MSCDSSLTSIYGVSVKWCKNCLQSSLYLFVFLPKIIASKATNTNAPKTQGFKSAVATHWPTFVNNVIPQGENGPINPENHAAILVPIVLVDIAAPNGANNANPNIVAPCDQSFAFQLLS